MNLIRATTLVLACALLALCAGMWLGGHPESLPDPLRDAFVEDDRAVRAELIEAIEDNFIRPVDAEKLHEESLKGVVRSLKDRFSSYLTPDEAKLFARGLEGKFEGVGLNVGEDRRGLAVLKVFEDSPAERAGIHAGEFITAVDGRSIAGLNADVAANRIKGPPGTKVKLEVLTPRSGRRRQLTLERAEIDLPVAESRVVERGGEKLGVVTLFTFSRSGTHGELRKEVDAVLERGAEGILLDLRGNGGGLLREAVLVASIFVEDGLIVSTRGRTKPEKEFEAAGDAIPAEVPVVVLVDGGSASASEIVTGALRDRDRAVVAGTRTFGKGVFQELQPLSNGGVLDLTVGRYYLPSGEDISDKGIKPTVRALDRRRTERDEALPVALDALASRTR